MGCCYNESEKQPRKAVAEPQVEQQKEAKDTSEPEMRESSERKRGRKCGCDC